MGALRRQYTDEFKREAVGLLASSSRPSSLITQELGIPAARLRAWRISPPNRQSARPLEPVSTKSGEGHLAVFRNGE
jgi:transposase